MKTIFVATRPERIARSRTAHEPIPLAVRAASLSRSTPSLPSIQTQKERPSMKPILSAFALILPLTLGTQAHAHATFAETEVVQGQTARLTLRVGHGCGDEATLRVRVRIPEGLIAAQPMVKAGWALETVSGPYEASYELYGRTVTEGVREIIWSGELPDAYYDEFVFRARVTDTVAAGEMLYIPAIQECANGAERWIEIPAAGQDSHDLEGPAPGVMVVPATTDGHSH